MGCGSSSCHANAVQPAGTQTELSTTHRVFSHLVSVQTAVAVPDMGDVQRWEAADHAEAVETVATTPNTPKQLPLSEGAGKKKASSTATERTQDL